MIFCEHIFFIIYCENYLDVKYCCIIRWKIQQILHQKTSKNFIVRNVTLDALRKEISIDILTARNIIQQIQQKYNRKYFIGNNFEKPVTTLMLLYEKSAP